jgi:hypothetical protein
MKSMYGIDSDPQFFALLSYSASYVLELHQWEKTADLPMTPGTDLETIPSRTLFARSGPLALVTQKRLVGMSQKFVPFTAKLWRKSFRFRLG